MKQIAYTLAAIMIAGTVLNFAQSGRLGQTVQRGARYIVEGFGT